MTTILSLLIAVLFQAAPDSTPQGDRDAALQDQARRQATRVMNAGLEFAEKMLDLHREFPPFGAVMLPTGLIQTVGTREVGDDATAEAILAELHRGLNEGVDTAAYRSVAVFALVEVRHPEDGHAVQVVHVALEHEGGFCADIYYPTVLEGERLVLGDAFAARRAGTFFDDCP